MPMKTKIFQATQKNFVAIGITRDLSIQPYPFKGKILFGSSILLTAIVCWFTFTFYTAKTLAECTQSHNCCSSPHFLFVECSSWCGKLSQTHWWFRGNRAKQLSTLRLFHRKITIHQAVLWTYSARSKFKIQIKMSVNLKTPHIKIFHVDYIVLYLRYEFQCLRSAHRPFYTKRNKFSPDSFGFGW